MSAYELQRGYVPGVIGRLTDLHARYYGDLWELGPQFEADIADGIAEFVARYDPARDGLWTVVDGDDRVLGGIVVDGRAVGAEGAQVRYFILAPSLHGRGLGRDLLDAAMAFCRRQGYDRVFLWTVDELEAAVHLYREFGFAATDERDPHTDWETTVPYRLYERHL
ncbi:GNAT family N-acetyltransferase [Salinigranum rubrum]|uniref:GNAT family N-acetyltransferase n=1 Tax=Salinigranum rubrum TaxID=755307 RepID=A0A2I8VLG0_9EURY|nr:GNAT family N-acetyltransferase [Salinigranum rubrum]AUV82770.1 GNAT family N-acetyltransferase [Salinigranum rubrum]